MDLDCLKEHISARGLLRSGILISKKGKPQHWSFDLRAIFLLPECLKIISEIFWSKFADHSSFQIGALETAGIPLLTALQLTAPPERQSVNGFIIRKERKTTGLGRIVEGVVTDDPIILVDDIFNSGNSLEKARSILHEIDRRIAAVFVVVDFHSRKGSAWKAKHETEINSIFSPSEFGLRLPREPRERHYRNYQERWKSTLNGGFAYHLVPKSAPVLHKDKVYRGSDSGKMHCFSAETGEILWEFHAAGAAPTKGIWSTPAIHDGLLYFGAYNGSIYCLNAETGNRVWAHSYCEWIGASPLIVPNIEMLFIGLEFERPRARGALTALNLTTGTKVWEIELEKYQHGSASYSTRNNLVFWGSADHEMLCIAPESGDVMWRFRTGRSVKCAPAVDDERQIIAFASFDQSIYVLDQLTGKVLAQWKTDDICYTTPLIAGGKLFCGSADKNLYVADLQKMEMIAYLNVNSRVFSSPRQIGDSIIFGTNGGKVIELAIDSLEIRGAIQLPDAITNAIEIGDDGRTIYVSTAMNALYAFDRQ